MSYKQIPNLPPIIAASSDMLFEAVQGGSSGKVSLDILFQFINDRVESYLVLPTRELFVARIVSGHYDGLSNGWVVEAGGYTYRRVIGADDIEDMPDWVPNGNIFIFHFASQSVLSADAQPSIRSALLYARTQVQDIPETPDRPGFAGHVSVNLGGGSWLVSNTVSMDQCAGVELIEGALIANSTNFPAPVGDVYPYVLKYGGANNSGSRYMNLRNITIECNKVSNGIDCINLQNGIGKDINIHGQVQYGFRKYGSRNGACRFENIRASEFWAAEPGVTLRANRTSIGISDESADEIYDNCEGVYCLINIRIKGAGAHRHFGGHPFHGPMTDIPTYIITDAVSDGSGGTRCSTTSTSGMIDGELYVMPYIVGISGVDVVGGRPGVYAVSNITPTTFDVVDYIFAGVYDDPGEPKASLWADEMINVLVEETVDTADLDLEIDNGKVQVKQTDTNSPDVRMKLYGVGQNVASARVALELLSDGKVDAQFGGVQSEIHTTQNGYRFVAVNSGTISSVPRCSVNEFRSKKSNRSTELLAVGSGSASVPSLHFTSVDDGDAVIAAPTTGFFAHADHTPALTIDAVERLHFDTNALTPKNNYVIANTVTIDEFTTASAAGAYDDLPDGAGVILSGGVIFVRDSVSSYAGPFADLPTGFVPAVPSPFAFKAACDGVVSVVLTSGYNQAILTSGSDDTVAWRNLLAYCDARGIDPDLNGVNIVCIQNDADINFNCNLDGHGAEIRLIGGLYEDGTFSHATVRTAFRAYDEDCPIEYGTATVTDTYLYEGSIQPTVEFFEGPGFVNVTCNNTNGPWVTNRDRDGIDAFNQAFAVVKDGFVAKPLARSIVGTGSVSYRIRRMSNRGTLTIKNFVVDCDLFNNQSVFKWSRNEVNIENIRVKGGDLPYSQNQLLSVDHAAFITYHKVVAKGQGDPDESKSSYVLHASYGAEIEYNNCIGLGRPWGASGQNRVSGTYWNQCVMNRIDGHQDYYWAEINGCTVHDFGVGYGRGGGNLVCNDVTFVNSEVYHRSDWAGDWFGKIILNNCTAISNAYEILGVNLKKSPLGSTFLNVQAPGIEVNNFRRINRDLTASQITPYAMTLRTGSLSLVAQHTYSVDGVTSACDYRCHTELPIEDMTIPVGYSRTVVSFANIIGANGYTTTSTWTFVPPATTTGLSGHNYDLRIHDCSEVAVDIRNSPSVRESFADSRIVANYMADNCIYKHSDLTYGTPLILSGFTSAPVGGAMTSGTFNFGSIVGGRVEATASAWDFTNPRFITGVVIPTSSTACIFPFGANRMDMFRGWTPEMVGQTIMIRQSADRTLSSVTTSQPIFDEGGFSKVAVVVGVYKYTLVYRVENMDAVASSNLRFDAKGAGTAVMSNILYDSSGRDATNLMTSAGTLTGIMVAVESSLSLLNGAASANAGGTLEGYFEITADGTIQPSFLLAVAAAATVKSGTTFECTKIGSSNIIGPWSS